MTKAQVIARHGAHFAPSTYTRSHISRWLRLARTEAVSHSWRGSPFTGDRRRLAELCCRVWCAKVARCDRIGYPGGSPCDRCGRACENGRHNVCRSCEVNEVNV